MTVIRKKVFVASDLSEGAEEAIRQGDAWARSMQADLVVCHVMPDPLRFNVLFPQLHEQMALDLPALREEAVEELSAETAEITGRSEEEFAVIVDAGHPAAVIVERAEHYDADLIVVGSHGHSGGNGPGLGSVATQVLRHAHCPVLVARPYRPTGVVLCATDFSDPALPAVNAAVFEAKRRSARLVLLHVIDAEHVAQYEALRRSQGAQGGLTAALKESLREAVMEKLKEALRDACAEGETVVREGTPAGEIVDAADELHAELVVVGAVGQSGLRRLRLGSVAEAVAYSSPVPVLAVREYEDEA